MTPQVGLYSKEAADAAIAAHAAVADAHHAKVHGAAEHTNVTRMLFVPAQEGEIVAGNPYSIGNYPTVSGGADANEPYVLLSFRIPDDFVSLTSLKAVWSSEAVSGNMYWRMAAAWNAAGEDYDATSETEDAGATATGGQSKINVQDQANPLTFAGLAVGDYVAALFYRNGADALDTLDTGVDLLGLLFTYVASQ